MITELERFTKKVRIRDDGCWEWTGQRSDGYGIMRTTGGRRVAAHIWSYEHYIGPRPKESIRIPGKATGTVVADHVCHQEPCPGGHQCSHRRCVNPEHIQWVPSGTNASRSAKTWAPRCRNGHPWADNTRILPGGKRQCITCQNERSLAHWHRKNDIPRKRPKKRKYMI